MQEIHDKDWRRWAEYVLATIEAHNKAIEKQWKAIADLQIKVNTLQVKAATYGAILGFIAGITPSLIQFIFF